MQPTPSSASGFWRWLFVATASAAAAGLVTAQAAQAQAPTTPAGGPPAPWGAVFVVLAVFAMLARHLARRRSCHFTA